MANASNIEWTDATWNPTVGCSPVSPGCANCYAEAMAKRLRAMAGADDLADRAPGRKRHYLHVLGDTGRWNGVLELVREALNDPFSWRKPRRVFVNSMSDLFHEAVPFDFVDEVWQVMERTSCHTYQILTKRPSRMAAYLADRMVRPLPNVWLGTSVESQKYLDRITWLSQCPAAVKFVSFEPLLGDLGPSRAYVDKIDWAIIGGESGRGARQFRISWARNIIAACKAGGVPVFVKQLGASTEAFLRCPKCGDIDIDDCFDVLGADDGNVFCNQCKHEFSMSLNRATPKDGKGGNPAEWPSDLRIREFPAAK